MTNSLFSPSAWHAEPHLKRAGSANSAEINAVTEKTKKCQSFPPKDDVMAYIFSVSK